MKNLGKKEFVREVSIMSGMTQDEVRTVLESMIFVFEDAIKEERTITINGFLKLQYQKIKARAGYNIKNHSMVEYPECKRITFKVSTTLRDLLRKNKRFGEEK